MLRVENQAGNVFSEVWLTQVGHKEIKKVSVDEVNVGKTKSALCAQAPTRCR